MATFTPDELASLAKAFQPSLASLVAAEVARQLPKPPRLLYRNDFNTCGLAPIKSTWGTGAWQDLINAPTVDPSLGSVRLLSITDPVQVKTDGSDIETVVGHKIQAGAGRNNTAGLVQTIYKSGNGLAPMGGAPTQASFQFLPLAEVASCYVSMWLMFDPNVVESFRVAKKTTGGAWRQLICLKTGGQLPGGGPNSLGDYRMQIALDMTKSSVPVWRMVWDNNGGQTATPYKADIDKTYLGVPVPIGEWFQLELCWRRGLDGRMALYIDGEQVFDQYGANLSGQPLNRLMLPILYTGGQLPAAQWLDSIEVWDRPPSKASIQE